jgi:hypothetical protein
MDLVFVPSACKESKDEAGKEIPAKFSGSITIKLPTMPESYRIKAKYGRKSVDTFGGKTEDSIDSRLVLIELLADIADEIKGNLLKVDLVYLQDNKKIKSADDLYSFEPGFEIIAEIGSKFLSGFAEKN